MQLCIFNEAATEKVQPRSIGLDRAQAASVGVGLSSWQRSQAWQN